MAIGHDATPQVVTRHPGRPGVTRQLAVVGYGMVGRRLLEALTARDPDRRWQITVYAEEPRAAYDRVHLSSLFDGRTDAELTYPDLDGPSIHLGQPVLGLDPATRSVTTAAGRRSFDAIVLATGSVPFVPPVPGTDRPGVFVYRTIADVRAIAGYSPGCRTGVVVGGGLLGLEAANALRLLGLRTHVVEFADRLMPVQVDRAGGAMLRRHVEALGVELHLGTATTEIGGDPDDGGPGGGPVRWIRLGDGELVPADLVVIAAGIRPADQLGRDAGLPIGARGGFLVDRTCQTPAAGVYAIGECAALDGRCYGLVAPGYSMAEVVADRLVGGSAVFAGADTATKLKLLGVDVASFGQIGDGPAALVGAGATGASPQSGTLDVTFFDPTAGVYAKLVLSDDARTLLGGVLVGDASAYPTLRACLGGPLPGPPLSLLAPTGADRAPAATGLAGSAQVCTCNAVTKDRIVAAIADGAADLAGVQCATRAGTACGSCVPLVKQIMAESGLAQPRALCEHFAYTRAELFEVIAAGGITTFSALVERYGTGRGCDVCKPVVASILASLDPGGYILDGEPAALQDTNDHFLANIQRNGTYSVVPRIPGGEITPQRLITIGEVARDFGLYTKITGGQRIDLLGARVEQLPLIWRRLVAAGFESGHAYGKALRTVKSCVGSTWCRFGVQDSVAMAIELELRYRGLRAPHKIKSGVSGCARECAEARSKDFGIIATETGWNLYLGGNGGFRPRHGELFAKDLSRDELIRTIDRYLMFYIRTADRLQRTAAWIEAMDGGLDHLRAVIVEDSLGLCAELDAAMARHVANYTDEWRATLDDPDRMARFVSFVNAPATPDPTLTFRSERGQPVPVLPAAGTDRPTAPAPGGLR